MRGASHQLTFATVYKTRYSYSTVHGAIYSVRASSLYYGIALRRASWASPACRAPPRATPSLLPSAAGATNTTRVSPTEPARRRLAGARSRAPPSRWRRRAATAPRPQSRRPSGCSTRRAASLRRSRPQAQRNSSAFRGDSHVSVGCRAPQRPPASAQACAWKAGVVSDSLLWQLQPAQPPPSDPNTQLRPALRPGHARTCRAPRRPLRGSAPR